MRLIRKATKRGVAGSVQKVRWVDEWMMDDG